MECLNEMLSRNARLLGDRPFIVTDSETISYAEFNRRASRLAHVLASLGVRKGDPVGLYLPSGALLATGYWACQKLGAIPAPMSVMYRDTEIGGIVARTGTPKSVVSRIAVEMREIQASASFREAVGKLGMESIPAQKPEHFGAIIAVEQPAWAELVKAAATP